MTDPLRVVICGGGTAGWMTAAALVALLPDGAATVTLVESDTIGTVGVGEATLPHMRAFNDAIGLIESDAMRRTGATFKLGIEFVGWGRAESSYIHPFGDFGHAIGGIGFQHHWLRADAAGDARAIEAYSLAIQAARAGRFDFPDPDRASIASTFDYAYHLDATLYTRHLRALAERRGTTRAEGRIIDVARNGATGAVAALVLESGERIAGDLFVDCSGFRSLLLGEALAVGWHDWSHWLPCDRALAVPTEGGARLPPYTRATAQAHGWQWRIPLQHRTGNGYIYSSSFVDDDTAHATLMGSLPDKPLADPRQLRFTPGRRTQSWSANCIGIGLASGFLEPLESTSIYLIQVAIMNLVRLFPRREIDPALAHAFNHAIDLEYDRIRDFLILHYHANARDDGAMWRHCAAMSVPDSLTETIELFRHRAALPTYRQGLFSAPSWLAVLMGQGVRPTGHHPIADTMDVGTAAEELERIRCAIDHAVAAMPTHETFVADYCEAVA